VHVLDIIDRVFVGLLLGQLQVEIQGAVVVTGQKQKSGRIGADLIVVEVDHDGEGVESVCGAVSEIPGVQTVTTHHGEVTIAVSDGDATISPVVVALHDCGVRVTNVSLRRPTLDDVFLELTGAHLREEELV
jgi:ABC-2 type transport system ATP-binding protein